MRLISQDGMIDVPYEISALSIGGMGEIATIYVRSKLLDEKPCVFATYSTTDKALKVVEMLKEWYIEHFDVNLDSCWYSNDYPKIFQFPKDEEVEINNGLE